MNQERVNSLAAEVYRPRYAVHAEAADVRAAVARIAAEEEARGFDAVQTVRGIRTRVHEHLQTLAPVVDPPVTASSAGGARAALEEHHDHQTAHFQALWQITDALVSAALGGAS